MDFDGALGKERASVEIWIWSPICNPGGIPSNVREWYFKFSFDLSNNEAEYEALITGLKILKKLGTKIIFVYGDSELVIKQVKG